MTKTNKLTAALLLAGVMAGGAIAQTSDIPVQAGEASTVTNGVPNMTTNNNANAGVGSASGVAVDSASSTAVMGAAPAVSNSNGREVPNYTASGTSNIPTRAGEFSTMTNGQPNMSTHNPVTNESRVIYPPVQKVERIPSQAGEASTMVGGRFNANPDDPILNRNR